MMSEKVPREDIQKVLETAVNAPSGSNSQPLRFDGKIINSINTIDLFFERLGNHTLFVDTSDRAANPASQEVSFRIIATPESTIVDIERSFSLGWISNHGVATSLVQKAKQSQWEAFFNELEAQRGKHINEQAYRILKENIEWLLTH